MIPLLVMIILHSGAGVEIDLQTDSITNLRNPEPHNRLFANGIQCVVNMNDGKYIGVKETCSEIKRLMDRK